MSVEMGSQGRIPGLGNQTVWKGSGKRGQCPVMVSLGRRLCESLGWGVEVCTWSGHCAVTGRHRVCELIMIPHCPWENAELWSLSSGVSKFM